MRLLDIRIPPEAIDKLFRLKDKMTGAPLRRSTSHSTRSSTPDPTYRPTLNSASKPASNSTPSLSQNHPTKRRTTWRGNRLRDIFPPGLESKSKSSRSPYHFTPQHLNDILSHDSGEKHAEHTVVRSAWYGKQTKSAKHEFIVINVEDITIPGLINCIAIDRNQGAAGYSSPLASDAFRVSYDGDLPRLLEGSNLTPHLELEYISFHSDELLLRDLVALVSHISERHNRYNPVDTNCYWFTGLIWECLREMRPNAKHEVILAGKKGRISYARFVPNPIQVRHVLRAVEKASNKSEAEDSSSNSVIGSEEGLSSTASLVMVEPM